jgi:hypothetical protein
MRLTMTADQLEGRASEGGDGQATGDWTWLRTNDGTTESADELERRHVTALLKFVSTFKIDGRYPAHASKLSILPANNEAHPERIWY